MKVKYGAAALVILALATGTACVTPDSPAEQSLTTSSRTAPTPVPPKDYRYPTDVAGPYTVVWSAADGIDLHSRPAELARAYLESCQLSVYGRQAAYPGAMTAAPKPSVENRPSCLYAPKWPEPTFPALFGTMYANIAEIRVSDDEVSARGCYLRNGRAEVDTWEPQSAYLSAYEFSFTARLPPQTADPRADVRREAAPGPGTRAPQFDVFYPWKFDAVPWGARSSPQPPVSERPCTAWGAGMLDQIPAYRGQNPITPDGREAMLIPELDGPEGFPTLPQSPAWPSP